MTDWSNALVMRKRSWSVDLSPIPSYQHSWTRCPDSQTWCERGSFIKQFCKTVAKTRLSWSYVYSVMNIKRATYVLHRCEPLSVKWHHGTKGVRGCSSMGLTWSGLSAVYEMCAGCFPVVTQTIYLLCITSVRCSSSLSFHMLIIAALLAIHLVA